MSTSLRHALTVRGVGRLAVLTTPVKIEVPGSNPEHPFTAIWDTGAMATVITQPVVDQLGLIPIGRTLVNTASANNVATYQYLIDLFLKDDLKIRDVVVTLGILTEHHHCLIGMDVITLGDFSLTNKDGNTCMSFRVPSLHEIDFVRDPHFGTSPFADLTPSKNQPCPCGSGKLYKRCHGVGK